MSVSNLNNNSPNGLDTFLKCLSQFYQSEFESGGDDLHYRKIELCDSILKAYNNKYKTKLKGYQLLAQLKQKEKSYQPYEWQKMFLDIFNDENGEAPIHKNQKAKLNVGIQTMNVCEEAEQNVKKNDVFDVSAKSSSNAVISVECKPDIPAVAHEMDYKTMSNYELKRAFLISKLEMLDAQEALRRAKENIKLNEEEYLKRRIDEE